MKRGKNEIVRLSTESSVTVPHEVTYRNLDNDRAPDNTEESEAFNFCGCGWPQNLLIAKGSPEGFPCQLFVMVSNGAVDQVRIIYTEFSVQKSRLYDSTPLAYLEFSPFPAVKRQISKC